MCVKSAFYRKVESNLQSEWSREALYQNVVHFLEVLLLKYEKYVSVTQFSKKHVLKKIELFLWGFLLLKFLCAS